MSYAPPSEKPTTPLARRYSSSASSLSESAPPKWRSTQSHKKLRALKIPDGREDYKPFDAIINFLPHRLSDKALLKHAILVTTLSAQFLASPTCTSITSPSHSPTNASPSHSHSSASQSIASPSSRSTPDTSPCPSPPPKRLSKNWDLTVSPISSRTKNRFSLLFRSIAPPPSSSPFWPLPEVSDINEESRTVKNAHIVHVLPLGWSSDSAVQPDRDDRRASSSSTLGIPTLQSHSPDYIKTLDGTGKPKLVQSIEQFLLSFAYPLRTVVLGNSGSGSHPGVGFSSLPSNSNKKPKPARPLSFNQEHTTITTSRPKSFLGSVGNAEAYEPENPLRRASTLSISPNINTPLKPTPYLLAPGVFGKHIPGSGGSNIRAQCPSWCGIDEDDLGQNHEDDVRNGAYMHSEATALTVGEIILLGALDFDHTCPGAGPGNGRAWIGNVDDVIVVGGSPDQSLYSGKGKGREVEALNTEMMKTAKRRANFGLLTPPGSSSGSNSSAECVEEQEKEMSVGHTRMYAQPTPPASPTYLDDIAFDKGVGEALVISLTPTTSTSAMNSKATGTKNISSKSLPSTPMPTTIHGSSNSTPATFNSKRTNKVEDKNSGRFSDFFSSAPCLPSAVQVPPLVVHRDRARPSPESRVRIPPMSVSMEFGSQSASGSGLGSGLIQTQSPMKGSERKSFVGTLKKMGLWKNGNGESIGLGTVGWLKA